MCLFVCSFVFCCVRVCLCGTCLFLLLLGRCLCSVNVVLPVLCYVCYVCVVLCFVTLVLIVLLFCVCLNVLLFCDVCLFVCCVSD